MEQEKLYSELPNVYRAYNFDRSNVKDMWSMENDAFDSALEKLDTKERKIIKGYADHLSSHSVRIRNLGKRGALEVLAKIGIFLSLNDKRTS